jgi:Sec-independent protein translocase protein TatA
VPSLGLGFGEIFVIVALVIVFVGPDRMPQLFRTLGRQYGKLMRASDELKRAFVLEADRVDADKRAEDLRRRREEAKKRAEEARAMAQAERAANGDARPDSTGPVARLEEHEASLGGAVPPVVPTAPTDPPGGADAAARALADVYAPKPPVPSEEGT